MHNPGRFIALQALRLRRTGHDDTNSTALFRKGQNELSIIYCIPETE
jgi:hypothetical protein